MENFKRWILTILEAVAVLYMVFATCLTTVSLYKYLSNRPAGDKRPAVKAVYEVIIKEITI